MLGDCSTVNKTLVVNYNTTPITITFNVDYTAISDASIITDINTALGGNVLCTVGSQSEDFLNFSDCISTSRNNSTATINKGDAVIKVGSGFKLAQVGDTPYGFAGNRANPDTVLDVSILGKCLFNLSQLNATVTTDGYYKCGVDGSLVFTTVKADGVVISEGQAVSIT